MDQTKPAGSVADLDTADEFVKISANLPTSVVETLKQVAKMRGTTMTEVLRHAISMEKFLLDAQKEGAKILVENPDKTIRQLVVA
jgi:hypothetical protein